MKHIRFMLPIFAIVSACDSGEPQNKAVPSEVPDLDAASNNPIPTTAPEKTPINRKDAQALETWSCDGSPGPFVLTVKSEGKGVFVSDGSPWGDGLKVTKREDSYIIDGEIFGFKRENGILDKNDMAWFSEETGDPIYCKKING